MLNQNERQGLETTILCRSLNMQSVLFVNMTSNHFI